MRQLHGAAAPHPTPQTPAWRAAAPHKTGSTGELVTNPKEGPCGVGAGRGRVQKVDEKTGHGSELGCRPQGPPRQLRSPAPFPAPPSHTPPPTSCRRDPLGLRPARPPPKPPDPPRQARPKDATHKHSASHGNIHAHAIEYLYDCTQPTHGNCVLTSIYTTLGPSRTVPVFKC